MVTSTRPVTKTGPGGKIPGPNGNKSGGNGWQGGDGRKRKFSPASYQITMWVILAAIVMMFAALSSAYIVLAGGENRQSVTAPRMFFLSTGIIALSSWTLEKAKSSLSWQQGIRSSRWLALTLFLGSGFLASQVLGWRELARKGVYFAGRPDSTFFYLFTGVHGIHLLGGISLLAYLAIRFRHLKDSEVEKNNTWALIVARYWHTMGLLWIWLFVLLLVFK